MKKLKKENTNEEELLGFESQWKTLESCIWKQGKQPAANRGHSHNRCC